MPVGRITQSAIFDKIRADLSRHLGKLKKAQNVLTTGKRVNRPSDDPISVVQIMRRKIDINRTDRFIKNTENARTRLSQTSSVLIDVTAQLNRAREIAISFANEPKTEGDSKSAKIEVENILSRMINLANTKDDNRYIFAGAKSFTQPFETNGIISDITYKGNMRGIERQVSPNATMTVNVPGVSLFSDGIFLSLIRLSETVDIEKPSNELVADTALTTSEMYSIFTESGSSANEATEINDLDQVTTDLSDGDTITILGKDSNGYAVEENFTYGADNDGTTLEELVTAIDNAYENSTVTINNNGKVILDFPVGPMPAPEVTIQFNNEDASRFILPKPKTIRSDTPFATKDYSIANETTEINDLNQVISPLNDDDQVTIYGKDSDGTTVNTTFTYGAGNDGTTLGNLVTTIDNAFGNSTVAIDDNGDVTLTPPAGSTQIPELTLDFRDEGASNIVLPVFNTVPVFTVGGSSSSSETEINGLDQVTADLDAGDIITIAGTDSDGMAVDTAFTYGTDGTTLGDLVTTIDNAFMNTTVTIDNGNLNVNPPIEDLTLKFIDQGEVSNFTLPQFKTVRSSTPFTGGGSPAGGSNEINDLDQVTSNLDAGDIITIVGKDSDGTTVDTTFTYGNDGTTLGDLVTTINGAFGNSTVTIDSNGDIILQTGLGERAPELTLKFIDKASSSALPAFSNIEINQLDQITTDLSDGDTITISGTDSDRNDVNAIFTYGAPDLVTNPNGNGTTLGDLLSTINEAFGDSTTVTIDDDGYIRLTPEEGTGYNPSLSLEFTDVDESGNAITLPQFVDKMKDSIDKIDSALDKVSEFQAELGSKINRLDDTKSMLEDAKLNITEFISQEEDADMTDAITEFIQKQTAYQTTLNAAIRIMQQPSLMDFLR